MKTKRRLFTIKLTFYSLRPLEGLPTRANANCLNVFKWVPQSQRKKHLFALMCSLFTELNFVTRFTCQKLTLSLVLGPFH